MVNQGECRMEATMRNAAVLLRCTVVLLFLSTTPGVLSISSARASTDSLLVTVDGRLDSARSVQYYRLVVASTAAVSVSGSVAWTLLTLDGREVFDASPSSQTARLERSGTYFLAVRGQDRTRYRVTSAGPDVSVSDWLLTPDTRRPTLRLSTPVADAVIRDGILPVRGIARDRTYLRDISLRVDGGPARHVLPGRSWFTWLDTSQLDAGPHSLAVQATDAAGNVRRVASHFRVSSWLTGSLRAKPGTTLPRRTAFVVPASVAADCSRPVDAEVNRWLTSLPDHSEALFRPKACYAQAGSFKISDKVDIVVDGNGSAFRAVTSGNSTRANWRIQGGRGIVLRHLDVFGANPAAGLTPTAYDPAHEWQHGFTVNGTDGFLLDDAGAYDVYGDFFEAHFDERVPFPLRQPAKDVVVRDAHFARSGRQGIGITDVDGFRLEGSSLAQVNMAAIDIEIDYDGEVVRNVSIHRNIFDGVRFSLLSDGGVGRPADKMNITFDGNRMLSVVSCRPPVFIYPGGARAGWRDLAVLHNQLLAFGDAVYVGYADGVTVRGNVVRHDKLGGCGTLSGVRLVDSRWASVQGNRFIGADAAVVKDSSSSLLKVGRNRLT